MEDRKFGVADVCVRNVPFHALVLGSGSDDVNSFQIRLVEGPAKLWLPSPADARHLVRYDATSLTADIHQTDVQG